MMSYEKRVARRGGTLTDLSKPIEGTAMADAKPKVIRNRFPGTCACGARVPSGGGIAHLVGSEWEVECAKCSEQTDIKPLTVVDRARLKARLVDAYKAVGSPHFGPVDGKCFYCKGDIIVFLGEEYGKRPITGCPMCSYSYCE